ncbi:CBS domain-containing protein [Halanaeroarchaeum sulfurireducens]|uniref:CBS domain-containing protein n=1 Tax=Halanaeroarchaeum sulfurireducens TaxID=1604004 RepID=A0A0F7PCT8_9EURY|nr:CBS domain-containing protein [Halanaeroarchaeum sulfurireducens]AKH98537.1 CBS domain-containing protein [Halanaeroarchaeum sulfurireducens]ALG82979.1 CBS domain-containing protein [Halanaeroarchaeum sulfurireducens]
MSVVRDIMTTDLVTVPLEESLQETVSRMLNNRVGSVVVKSGPEPAGIVTETDVLAVGTTFECAFEEIPVSRAMSANLVTASPDTSIEDAMATLHDHGIKKLPVVEDDELVGIVTMTDFVYHQHELAQEAEKLDRERVTPVDLGDYEE